MDVNILRIVATLASFFVFMGIVCWTYSSKRKAEFTEAANAPFVQD